MSKIRSMVVGLVVVAGMAGVAQAQAPQGERQPGARGEMRRDGKDRHVGGRGMRGLLRGINLTDAEKANLKKVGEKYHDQLETIREAMRPDFEAARAARQRGDMAAARAAFVRTAPQRAKLDSLMQRMQADARVALTPEHRAQFDANVARMKERMANRPDGWGGCGKRGRLA
jgi:Spy/CpxP family protein refolding chaperone